MNRGRLVARSLNLDLRQALNSPGELRVERFGSTYGMGDKVTQIENDYDKGGLQRRPRRRSEHRGEGQ
jgi:exodeoxyribonuclease V alpha subunit